MKVAIIHDDLVQWGGAERVLLAISDIFPKAPIYTSLFDNSNPMIFEKFVNKNIVTSFMNKIPAWKTMYRMLLPIYPVAFESFDLSAYDLVISHTTRFAKCILTKPQTKHICFCATPPRFLWNFSADTQFKSLLPYLNFLRVHDQVYSKRVDLWVAGSRNAFLRIKKIYKTEPVILQPFVDDIFFNHKDSFDGGYYLIISRLNSYKRLDLAIEVFNKLGLRLRIVGTGPEFYKLKHSAKPNVEFIQTVAEKNLVKLISGCKALLVTGEEDFGLTSLEAQAMGKAVLAYGQGGALETVLPRKTGFFFFNQKARDLEHALTQFKNGKINYFDCVKNAQRFSKKRFQEKFKKIVENCLN